MNDCISVSQYKSLTPFEKLVYLNHVSFKNISPSVFEDYVLDLRGDILNGYVDTWEGWQGVLEGLFRYWGTQDNDWYCVSLLQLIGPLLDHKEWYDPCYRVLNTLLEQGNVVVKHACLEAIAFSLDDTDKNNELLSVAYSLLKDDSSKSVREFVKALYDTR